MTSIKPPTKVEKVLKLDYTQPGELWLTNQVTLRKLIGFLGVLLPFMLMIVTYLDVNEIVILDSISHYYFTRANSVFAVVVSLLAIFLLLYKGLDPWDFYLSSIAGLCALLLVLFPTTNIVEVCGDESKKYCITVLRKSCAREAFHLISAGVFLTCLAIMSMFVFTKTHPGNAQKTDNKKIRNGIYIICGIVMIVALFVSLLGHIEVISKSWYNDHHLTFWMETIAIWSFGISWLVKGETIATING
jgi:hypothetical protein